MVIINNLAELKNINIMKKLFTLENDVVYPTCNSTIFHLEFLNSMSGSGRNCLSRPEAGVLDDPYSAKPAQRSSHTGPTGYIGWTGHGFSLWTGGPVR